MAAFGAVDLFSGSSTITGSNLWQTDKNPLNQIDTGVEDVIGKQGQNLGNTIWSGIQGVIDSLLGIAPNSPASQALSAGFQEISKVFGDFFNLFGLNTFNTGSSSTTPGTGAWDPIVAIENLITDIFKPTNLLAMLVPNASSSAGVSGFIPMENLALDLIAGVVGGAQSVIDAILETVGIPAGSGTETQVNQYFTDLLNMLANPALTSGTFNPVTAVETFITDMIHPTNLLAPLVSGFVPTLNIPGLDASKIVSGTFANSFIPGLGNTWDTIIHAMGGTGTGHTLADVLTALENIPGVNIVSALLASVIPGLDATKIISGVFGTGQIPNLDASKIVSGVLNALQIPGLDATKITSGQFPQSMVNITSIAASIISGVLAPTTIPGLDATKIVSGILSPTAIPNITKAMSTDLQGVIDNIYQAMFGGSSTGNTTASVKTSLLNIPGVNIVSSLLASVIPGLDATKIISGVLSLGTIPSLPAGQITSGTFLASLIPGLDATKIVSGVFPQSMVNITSIAAGIVTGVLGAGQIPGLDATKIVSGIFPTSLIPGLDASQIVSGLFPQWLMPLVPVGSVGQTTPNLLANPTYATAASVAGSSQWIWDGATTHTADGSGSVKVTANGTLLQLLSDPATPVAQGHILNCSTWTQWVGVSGTGACIQLTLVCYLAGNVVSSTVLQTISSPAANGAWQQLSGTYTVPSGVDAVRVEYSILSACTAGTIWFDDASLTKTQLLAESWTAGLTGDLSNLNTAVLARALQTDVMSLVNNLGLGSFSSIGGSLSAITSRLNFLPASGQFDASQLGNIANIPLLPGGAIPGLDATKIVSGIMGIAQIPTSLLGLGNISDLQGLNNYITNTLVGAVGQFTGTTLSQSNASMQSLYGNMLNNTQSIQQMRAQNVGSSVSGVVVSINFANYANGPMPSVFTVTYSGSGSSQIGISGGLAGWFPANNDGNRQAFVIYNAQPTNTDYQLVSGSMNAAPSGSTSGGQPYFYALARVNSPSNPTTYVWGRAYCTGFLTYKADLGCTVNGVDTVWVTGISLTWSTSMSVVFGAQGNARRYQVFSGSQLVYDYTESGTTSQLGPGFRYWGAKNYITTNSGGSPGVGGTLVGTSVSDNQPPAVLGSTFRAHRASTGSVALANTSGAIYTTPSGCMDTLDYCSPDLSWDGNLHLTISVEGTYLVNLRYNTANAGSCATPALIKNNAGVELMGSGMPQPGTYGYSNYGIGGPALIYLKNGDVISPGYQTNTAVNAVGEAGGVSTYFEVALVNHSLS